MEIDFLQKKNVDSNPYDTDKMAMEFIQHFNNQAFSVQQQVIGTLLTMWRSKQSCVYKIMTSVAICFGIIYISSIYDLGIIVYIY